MFFWQVNLLTNATFGNPWSIFKKMATDFEIRQWPSDCRRKSGTATFAPLLLGRFGIIASFLRLNQKSFFLALLFEDAHGLFKIVFIGDFDFHHKWITSLLQSLDGGCIIL